MSANSNICQIKTPLFRMAFANVVEPKLNKKSGQLEYNLVMLFPKSKPEELIPFRKAVAAALEKKWGTKDKYPPKMRGMELRTHLSPGGDGFPIRDGDLQDYDGFAGMISVGCKSYDPIPVVDAFRNNITDKRFACSGMIARAVVNAYGYDTSGNRGVGFWLLGLQVCKDDGTRYGGAINPQTSFDDFEDPEAVTSAENPDNYNATGTDADVPW
jgi:hypothetical protein